MAKKETLEQFAKNLPKLPDRVQKLSLMSWNRNTLLAEGRTKDKAPMTIGNLVRSIAHLQARITKDGLESFLFAKVPYAKMLETGLDAKGDPITLKNEGEPSVYIKGSGWRVKQKKGEIGYMGKAVDETSDLFLSDISAIISKVWKET